MDSKEVQGSWKKVSDAHKNKKATKGYTTESQYMRGYRKIQIEKQKVKAYHKYVKSTTPRSAHTQAFWALQSAGVMNNMQLLIDGGFISHYAVNSSKKLRTVKLESKYDKRAVNAYSTVAGNDDLRKSYMLMDFIKDSHILDNKLTPEQRDVEFHKKFSKDKHDFHKKTKNGLNDLVNNSIKTKAEKLAPKGYSIYGAKARILHEALSQRQHDGGLYKRYFKWFGESPKGYKDIYPTKKTEREYRNEATKAKHPIAYAQMAGSILSIQKHKGVSMSEARNAMFTGLQNTAKKGFFPKNHMSATEQRRGFRNYCEALNEFDQNHSLGKYAAKSNNKAHSHSKNQDNSFHKSTNHSHDKSHDDDKSAEMDDDDGLDA